MLVGSSVENVLRPVSLEETFHVPPVGDVTNDCLTRYLRVLLFHVESDVMHRRLCLVYENETGWVVACYLLDHLAAYRTRSTRNQYSLATEHGTYGRHINLYLVAWQKVFNLHLLQLC